MAKTVLLTGATGFLGSHLLEALVKEGYQVVILKRSTSDTWRISHLLDTVKIYDVDIGRIDKAFEEQHIDLVAHLATHYRKYDNGVGIPEMVSSNIAFPLELLECGARNGVKGFINTGTFFECDCSKLPIAEDAPPKPFNLYARTKFAFEQMLINDPSSINTMTLRIFSPYGEKDNPKLIPNLIKKGITSETIELSDGLQKLDFVYVQDIVNAYLKACKKVMGPKENHSVYHIGSGTATSVREIVSILEQLLDKSINKSWGKPSLRDISLAVADIRKAKKELGWAPRFSIHEGLARTLEYYTKGVK